MSDDKAVTKSDDEPVAATDDEIRIGISACLLGQEVRFDGSHKRDRFIVGTLGQFFRFVPVCPELDIGLGVPRESLRLVRDLRVEGSRAFDEVLQGKEKLALKGEFVYQACDAKKCYRPASVPLKWTFSLEKHDLVRVPDELKRVAGD